MIASFSHSSNQKSRGTQPLCSLTHNSELFAASASSPNDIWAVGPRFIKLPIAQTSFAELAVMAKTSARSFFPNLGAGNRLHLVPFHCSITCPGCAPSVTFPTAQAEVGEISTTPCRKVLLSPLIIGAENAVHVVPSKWIIDCSLPFSSEGEPFCSSTGMVFGLERNVFHRRTAGGAAALDNIPALKTP